MRRTSLKTLTTVGGAAAALLILAKLARVVIPGEFVFPLLAAAAVVTYRMALDQRRRRLVAVGILLGCALLGVHRLGTIALANYHAPRTWDFTAFYLDGSVGARGLNFYQIENYRQVFDQLELPITVTPYFVPEIVEVGFRYPPVTMFLFCWMGLLPFGQAHLLWLAGLCASFGFAAWAIARHLLVDGSLAVRILAAGTLVTMLSASTSNMSLEQTNALLLAVSVLCLAAESGWRAGVYAALAISIKPILVLAPAYQFLRARWATLGFFAAALIALFCATAAVFGPDTVLDYVRVNPVGNVPQAVYAQTINQSLLGTLLRLQGVEALATHVVWHPPFLLIGGAVAAISTWLAWRLARKGDNLAFGLLVGAALLLYPGTQKPYGMLMLVPLAQLGVRLWNTAPGAAVFSAFILIVYYANYHVPFAAHAAVWAACCFWAVCAGKLEPYLNVPRRARPAP